jgi:hypothetical protein
MYDPGPVDGRQGGQRADRQPFQRAAGLGARW